MRERAEKNKKLKVKMEKEDALKKLGKNRNVQIISKGKDGGSSRKSLRFNPTTNTRK